MHKILNQWLSWSVTLFLTTAYSFLEHMLFELMGIQQNSHISMLIRILFVSLFLFIGISLWLLKDLTTVRHKIKHIVKPQNLKLRLGVYWDEQKNPYCTVCYTPLTESIRHASKLWCKNEGISFYLMLDRRPLTLEQARKLI